MQMSYIPYESYDIFEMWFSFIQISSKYFQIHAHDALCFGQLSDH